MLYFDDIHPGLRVVGELLDQGHDLLWRRRAHLYIVVPKEWTIPAGFSDRVMPEGYLDINDAKLVRLPSEFRLRRGKLISEDRYKASRHVQWFQYRVEEEYWKDLLGKGIILELVTRDLDPTIRATPPIMLPQVEVRVLVPRALPHRLPSVEEMDEGIFHRACKLGLFETISYKFYPNEPESTDDYDEFVLFDRIYDCDYYPSINETFLVFSDFESLRKRIQAILFE